MALFAMSFEGADFKGQVRDGIAVRPGMGAIGKSNCTAAPGFVDNIYRNPQNSVQLVGDKACRPVRSTTGRPGADNNNRFFGKCFCHGSRAEYRH